MERPQQIIIDDLEIDHKISRGVESSQFFSKCTKIAKFKFMKLISILKWCMMSYIQIEM